MNVDLTEILPPACPLGYTREQVEQITAEGLTDFDYWMRGQTVAVWDGRRFNYDTHEYEPTECGATPHGLVVYPWDLTRFIRGGGVLD